MCLDAPLIFLHGFLGSDQDWDPVIEHLKKDFRCIALNLYYFLKDADTFETLAQKINDSLKEKRIFSFHLIGYSLGGRICLALSQIKKPLSLTILSSHFGLQDSMEKKARFEKDLKWIKVLEKESFESFLEKWYEQPIFPPHMKECYIQKRISQNLCPIILCKILKNFSLGKQPFYLSNLPENTTFLYGQWDKKYKDLYEKRISPYKRLQINNAFHCLHLEKPGDVANLLADKISNTI